MNKSQRAALFVFLSLLATLIAGVVLYFVYAGQAQTAVPLLIACVLVAFGLVIAAARTTTRYRRSRLLLEKHQVPPSGMLHLLDLRQWLTLMLGITVIALGTGALTGVSILAGGSEPAVAIAPQPTPTTTTPPIVTPEPSDPVPSESSEPTESVEPTGTLDPSAEPIESLSEAPAPGSTKYLDSEEALAGYYYPKAVTFSATRYPRGITFYCSTATDSALQWNVAGTTRFHATAGIDDNTENSFGKVVEFLFYDQDGRRLIAKPVEISVGHPKEVKLDLTGVVSLRMTCAGRDAKTNEQRSTNVAFGDPIVVHE